MCENSSYRLTAKNSRKTVLIRFLEYFLNNSPKIKKERFRNAGDCQQSWIIYTLNFYIISSGISPPAPGPPNLAGLDEAITSSILRTMIAASVAALIA